MKSVSSLDEIPQPTPRSWVDRLLDSIVGEDQATQKHALICEKCYHHNGLVFYEELANISKGERVV
jgi:hypothetical protein